MRYLTQPYQLLICLQLLLFYSPCSAKLCSHDQSSALLQFKQLFSFEKDSSDSCDGIQQISRPKMMSWKEDSDCCSWDGVTCDSAMGHVIGLDLSCSWLRGNIPSNTSLFFLPRLRELNLAFNDFNYSTISSGLTQFPSLTLLNLSLSNFMGSIPASLGNNITQLIYLDLSENSFSGHIPSSFSNLQQLRHLDLSGNNFVGEIPASLGNVTQLVHLYLSVNNFSGHIPSSFSNLQQLHNLYLWRNKFVGEIPASLGNNITQLVHLDLSVNSFSGHIPSSFSNLQQLHHLDLWYNKFSGEIPDMFTNLTQLSYLNLAYNQLTGSIPSSIFQLVNLTNVYLTSNNLSGSVELYDFAKLKNLKSLYLSNNSLSLSTKLTVNSPFPSLLELSLSACNVSEFPEILRTQHQLKLLDLSENQIHGRIPSWMWGIGVHTLNTLDLSHNFLTSIEHLPWKNLKQLVLRSNLLQGSLLDLPPLIQYFSISSNNLTGEIPSSFCNLSHILTLYLKNNSLSGEIPQCLGNSTLGILDLQMNNLQGSIPQTYAKGCSLVSLNLNGNQLKGPLPSSLVNCQHLETLDVGNNQIDDTFPHWLDVLPDLQVLILRSNEFWGPIADTRTRAPFPKLRIIDLSHNQLTGVLPIWYLDSFKAMVHGDDNNIEVNYMKLLDYYTYYISIFVTMKGNDIQMERILTTFATIDLSCNRFQGKIPEVVGKLNLLKGLNISHNNLTGAIPSSLRNMTELEFLDLSSNKLTGHIPMQLASLNYLSVLNLSNNQLEGLIPRGPQFNTFPNDSYAGNWGLCGFPLSKSCSIDEALAPTTPKRFHEGDDAASWFDWKFAKMGYASGVVIGLSIGYMVFVTRRPRWFVRIIERKQSRKVRRVIRRDRARRRDL